jgi:hypothetical protein
VAALTQNLKIGKPSLEDKAMIEHVFETSIKDAYEREGIGHLKEELRQEIQHKKLLLQNAYQQQQNGTGCNEKTAR